ncbi:hypothetical protein NX773_17540 [Massilia solisilvae]|uniref:Uncharacterized protein n=1 Tax=Massilia solisilvae TaxID=1811225 RepID=A0ABT2BN70_9BURK|nr:hypothetical protein [Massilia solisilvae]MCS0609973.1 hypothetical protein [Massilia solisilvae]
MAISSGLVAVAFRESGHCGVLLGYAMEIVWHRKLSQAVQFFAQIQHNFI